MAATNHYDNKKDLELLEKVAMDDEQALKTLYERYKRSLNVYLRNGLGLSYDEANEVLEDIIVEIWKGAKTFAGRSSVRTWIYNVTRIVCLGRLRRQRQARERLQSLDAYKGAQYVPQQLRVTQNIQNVLNKDIISKVMARLSRKERELLTLMYWEGMLAREIAEVLGKPVGTVKSSLHNLRKKIAKILNEL